MKKIYLSICGILIVATVFSQQYELKNTNVIVKESKFKNYTDHRDNSKAIPFWSDDLSDPSLWTMTDYAHAGTQNWVITTNAPTGAYSSSMGAIASTTASNGFGIM